MNVDRRDCLKVATVTAGSLPLPVGVEAEVQGPASRYTRRSTAAVSTLSRSPLLSSATSSAPQERQIPRRRQRSVRGEVVEWAIGEVPIESRRLAMPPPSRKILREFQSTGQKRSRGSAARQTTTKTAIGTTSKR